MKKFISRTCLLIGALSTVTFVNPVYSASESECSIWLCLPVGFPSGCGKAKSAFKKRIRKGKSPLPSFSSCVVNGGGGLSSGDEGEITSKTGHAAYVPAHERCGKWERVFTSWRCREWIPIPTHTVIDTYCKHDRENDTEEPKGCERTIKYIQVYQNNQPYGEPYYFDRSGKEVVIPKQ